MKLPIYFAKRYLVSKKSKNVINIISMVSVVGVAIGTMALVVVLSVFNGLDNLIKSRYSSFDPDIIINPAKGKVFDPQIIKENVKSIQGFSNLSEVLEENVLLKYDKKQYVATIKGVDPEFKKMTGIDTLMLEGKFILNRKNHPMAVVGIGVSYFLSIGLNFINPIHVYSVKRDASLSAAPEKAFSKKYIFPSGVFSVQKDYDEKYIITPIQFARQLLNYPEKVSQLEVKLKEGTDPFQAKKELQKILGETYQIRTGYELNEIFFKAMKAEKWAIFLIMALILVVATFNIIGSLTMLIIEKKDDINTLSSLGANRKLINKIFLAEGWFISGIGALSGMILGLAICWVQQKFGLLKLQGTGSFIVDAYPVKIVAIDIFFVMITVLGIGFLASSYPVRQLSKKLLINNS